MEAIINSAINHEAKMMSLQYMAQDPGAWYSSRTLQDGFIKLTDNNDKKVWIPSKGALSTYNSLTLEPIGCVVRGEELYRGQWQLTESGLAIQGLLGRLQAWGLAYEDTSVQQLGRSIGNGKTRSPQNRIAIFRKLIDEPVGLQTISRDTGLEDGLITGTLRDLSLRGLIETRRSFTDTLDRPVEVLQSFDAETVGTYRSPDGEIIHEAAKAVQKEALASGGKTTLGRVLQEIEAICTERGHPFDKEMFIKKVGAPRKGSFLNGLMIDKFNKDGSLVVYGLSRNLQEPISELVRILDLHGTIDTWSKDAEGVEIGRGILSVPAKVGVLLVKAKRFSANAQNRGISVYREVVNRIITEQDYVDLEKLSVEAGISTQRAQVIIKTLASDPAYTTEHVVTNKGHTKASWVLSFSNLP